MAKYIITAQAEKDIDEILIYIATDNLDAALVFNNRLTDLFEMLADNTQAGRERPELKEELRSFPEDNYLIFYRLWGGKVAIVRVLYAARDLDELFA
ncbi:MAG: type II toxin-antitoxin system RelE/ParE family toxin [Acidobacteria bacterium]|nr:type II toxin-antitoxin system RelE/ParE family toxin [Acidobacteriota bacterium]